MPASVTTHKDFLRALHLLKPKYRKALLNVSKNAEINCICECIYNVLKGKILLQEKEKSKLSKYKNILRKLVAKGKSKVRKNIIIQKGGAFLPIILGAVLSTILSSIN